jgi:hypothetical protein
MVVPNRKSYGDDDNTQAAGAYVAYPKKDYGKTLALSTSTACIHQLFAHSIWDQKPLWGNYVLQQLMR